MSDDIENKPPHLVAIKSEQSQRITEVRSNLRELQKLSGDSKWTILQDITQEIEANYVAKSEKIVATELLKQLKAEVEKRYPESEEPEAKRVRELLLKSIPAIATMHNWRKADGWTKAIWDKIKNEGLFSKEKRANMINALYERGILKDTAAGKLWLTMSGDYSERPAEEKTAIVETFREINKILHKKN